MSSNVDAGASKSPEAERYNRLFASLVADKLKHRQSWDSLHSRSDNPGEFCNSFLLDTRLRVPTALVIAVLSTNVVQPFAKERQY